MILGFFAILRVAKTLAFFCSLILRFSGTFTSMTIDKVFHSDLAIPVGDYLVEVLEAKGISHVELGRRIGCSSYIINEIMKGERAINSVMAFQLERALDVPSNIWIGLECQYQQVKSIAHRRGRAIR